LILEMSNSQQEKPLHKILLEEGQGLSNMEIIYMGYNIMLREVNQDSLANHKGKPLNQMQGI
jgi:hypothetical protein